MKDNILITGKNGYIGKSIEGGREFKGRLEDYKELLKESEDVTGIVHLAAKSNRRDCEEDPASVLFSNILGAYNVLMAALERKAWVLFISTYQIRERSIYGLSKLMGEELCRMFKRRGLKVKILRLPIVYGPGNRSDKVVTKLIEELQSGIEPVIDTDEKFYFAYVGDVAKIIEDEVNILEGGYGRPYSLRSLTDGIKTCLKGANK
jgi:nucleoside-diphosphate-sugar epimerase